MSDKIRTGKVTDRRSLRFGRMEDLLRDAEAIDASTADSDGRRDPSRIRTTGNWSSGQIVWHVTELIAGSIDGLPFTAPWFLRLVGKMMRERALNHPLKPGISMPSSMKVMLPPAEVTWPQAMEHLKRQVGRIQSGTRMTVASPMFGPLSHEQWIQLHCRHAEMHFGFMHPARV